MFAIALISLLSTAEASDAKTYPGSFCQIADTTYETWLDGSRRYNDSSDTAVKMDCPVVRDNGTGITSSYLYVVDSSSSESVTCYLMNQSFSSTSSYAWSSTVSSTGSSGSLQKITTGAISSYVTGYLYFSCDVPAASSGAYSGIGGFYVNET